MVPQDANEPRTSLGPSESSPHLSLEGTAAGSQAERRDSELRGTVVPAQSSHLSPPRSPAWGDTPAHRLRPGRGHRTHFGGRRVFGRETGSSGDSVQGQDMTCPAQTRKLPYTLQKRCTELP